MSKKLVRYKVLPSDSNDWVIIELLDKHIKLDIQKETLTTRYDCIPHTVDVKGKKIPCSKYCCYAGCYITPHEIKFIEKILPDLKKNGYLPSDSIDTLETYRDEFYLPEDYDEEEELTKTRCAPKEPPEEYFFMDPDEDQNEEKDEDGEEEWIIDWDADPNSEIDDEIEEDSQDNEEELNDDSEDNQVDKNDTPEIDSGVKYEIEWDPKSSTFEVESESEKTDLELKKKKKSYIQNHENSIEKIPESHCLFLMANGLCSIHKYCSDTGLDWTLHKFNICTTFPMDLRVVENKTALDVPYPKIKRVKDDCNTLKMMDEYKTFPFVKMNCINLHDSVKKKLKVPYITESMKYAIVSRYGEEMWIAINDYARRYRKDTIKN